MDKKQAIDWLNELEIYFQKLAIMSQEDIEILSYTRNALNVKKIIALLNETL